MKARRSFRSLASKHDEPERAAVEQEIFGASKLSAGYLVLLFCSCGIAALGLLQSSAAVVIGAMLISPLMSPILGIGMALARVRPTRFREAAVTLALGALVSVFASALIVWASPLKDVTPEVLARTRPTLLDLVIALLSGLVAAYVVLTRKFGVIAGVAIATALMPPLAVVGFGVATGSLGISGGAFLLFMTNVVAIVGAVFAMARLYGYSPANRRHQAWEGPALVLVMAILSLPLGLSLRDIVRETQQTLRARSALEAAIRPGNGRIESFDVSLRQSRVTEVDAVIVTRRYLSDVTTKMRAALGSDVTVNVRQLLAAAAPKPPAAGGGALTNRALAGRATTPAGLTVEGRLRAMFEAVTPVAGVRRTGNDVSVLLAPGGVTDLRRLREFEAAADALTPGFTVKVVPAPTFLPPVAFAEGSAALDTTAASQLADFAWALERWGVAGAVVTGRASPGRNGATPADRALATRRAEAGAEVLREAGVAVRTEIEVPEAVVEPEAYWTAAVRPEAATGPGRAAGRP